MSLIINFIAWSIILQFVVAGVALLIYCIASLIEAYGDKIARVTINGVHVLRTIIHSVWSRIDSLYQGAKRFVRSMFGMKQPVSIDLGDAEIIYPNFG